MEVLLVTMSALQDRMVPDFQSPVQITILFLRAANQRCC